MEAAPCYRPFVSFSSKPTFISTKLMFVSLHNSMQFRRFKTQKQFLVLASENNHKGTPISGFTFSFHNIWWVVLVFIIIPCRLLSVFFLKFLPRNRKNATIDYYSWGLIYSIIAFFLLGKKYYIFMDRGVIKLTRVTIVYLVYHTPKSTCQRAMCQVFWNGGKPACEN